ncbi:type VI secretion system-associated protein TagF [Trinickia sp. LjRoot230]|uniref:type VI secretion system-associated protein TagF n=1 Tax=Trinickia sp. LjRoot230 TaxID=3342288 RepID=UPI003ECFC9CC
MPHEIMTNAAQFNDPDSSLAWYGKVPGAGDFVSGGLTHALADWWSHWMQQGLAAMHERGRDEFERHYAMAPIWSFLIPAGAGAACIQAGCLGPSFDRVGRRYPLVVTLPIRTAGYWRGLPDMAHAFYQQTGEALLEAIRSGYAPAQLERVLAQVALLSCDFSDTSGCAASNGAPGEPLTTGNAEWPGLSQYFDPHGATSFWWTHRAGGTAPRAHSHTGVPDSRLFVKLFGAERGA